MFLHKVEPEPGELEIVYDVQWKTPGNDDDKAKIIGIVDTPDTNLDWSTFKSYLIQNSGNMQFNTDDIRISYLDSDDDLIPVDSELEFRECLKFSRIRARRNQKVIMKVSKANSQGAKPKEPRASDYNAKNMKPKLFCLKKKDIHEKLIKKNTVSFDKACSTLKENDNKNVVKNNEIPDWFTEYMAKFKSDLLQELALTIRATLMQSHPNSTIPGAGPIPPHARARIPSELPQPPIGGPPSKGHHHHHHHLHHVVEKRKKKKKMPEEDSSDCTDGLQLNLDERLEVLRHMQKISKREKKFEKKLDAKLEKLETKTKKIMEKKHTLWNHKKLPSCLLQPVNQQPNHASASSAPSAVIHNNNTRSERPRILFSAVPGGAGVANAPSAPPTEKQTIKYEDALVWDAMDATPVEVYSVVPHVMRGDLVEQVWKVMNNGQVAWDDDTELRFAWGSQSLTPTSASVKCPTLKPGESGKIKVTLRAPMVPGNFESYWHFHHQGRRFGHWLGCAVIVDPFPYPETQFSITHQPDTFHSQQDSRPVDLRIKQDLQQTTDYDNKTSKTDDMKIHNIEKPDIATNLKMAADQGAKFENNTSTKFDNLTQKENLDNSAKEKLLMEDDLEEYPRLESYTSLTQPEIEAILKMSESNEMKPDLQNWTKILSPNPTNIVEKIQNDAGNLSEKQIEAAAQANNENTFNYDKILTKLETLRMQDEEKKNNDESSSVAEEAQEQIYGEYCSGSDSDNISIISGTVSVDTDSEPTDEFVVVPMPNCLNCEQQQSSLDSIPSETATVPVSQPISVEIPKTPSDSDASAVQTSDNNNNMKMDSFLDLVRPKPTDEAEFLSVGSSASGSQSVSRNQTNPNLNEETASEKQLDDKQIEEKKLSDDENTVYVKDLSGNSVPVARVLQLGVPSSVNATNITNVTSVRHSTFGDPNFGQGPNGPRFPFQFGNEACTSPPLCHNPGGPCNFRPQHESPSNTVFPVFPPSAPLPPNVQFYPHCCGQSEQQSQLQQKPSQNEFESRPNYMATVYEQRYKQKQNSQQQFAESNSQNQQQQQEQNQNEKKPSSSEAHCKHSFSSSSYCAFDEMYMQQEAMGAANASMTGSAAGPSAWTNAYHNIHTEQPRSCKYSYVFNNGAKETTSGSGASASSRCSSGSTRRSSTQSRETSPVAAAVQILPETLVTGAVNVASSAINTARSVIDMLRPRHEEPVVGQWEQVSPAVESSLRTLNEMGFNNRELNLLLLAQHKNDVARVISELVQ